MGKQTEYPQRWLRHGPGAGLQPSKELLGSILREGKSERQSHLSKGRHGYNERAWSETPGQNLESVPFVKLPVTHGTKDQPAFSVEASETAPSLRPGQNVGFHLFQQLGPGDHAPS